MNPESLLTELLEHASKRPLTETEQKMLQELLTNPENRRSALTEQYLRSNYMSTGQETQWTPSELKQIALSIEQQIQSRSRWQIRRQRIIQIAWGSAIVLAVFGFLLANFWLTITPTEPTAPLQITPTKTLAPSATPAPTPTLPAGYNYIDLMTVSTMQPEMFPMEAYSLTLIEASQQWDGSLYIPNQIPDNWSFVGTSLNKEQQVIEFAFLQTYFGTDTIWILSQSINGEAGLTPPLPVVYQPLPRIDNTFDYEDRATTVDEYPAHAYQYEYTYEETSTTWTVYNTVTWQQNEQLFTLTHISQRLEPSSNTARIAGYLWLQQLQQMKNE